MSETFVAKRFHLSHRAYVDSKNVKLQERFPKWLGDPSQSTTDGSTPFLLLPTELRLQIYGYLTHDGGRDLEDFKQSFNLPRPSYASTTLAYLYRSPGRVTKPYAISKEVITLFHVCHKMREELIDACFSDRTFILEACLYKRDAGGLFVLPSNPGPTAWVKKLSLLTVIEGYGFVKGIADLRPLQQMTNLKVLYLILKFTTRLGNRKPNVLERPDNILRAVVECVPKDTEVHFHFDSTLDCELSAYLKTGDENADTDSKTMLAALKGNSAAFMERKGRISGSLVNHSLCGYRACQEGLDCVNSRCKVVIHETKRSKVRMISNLEFETIKEQQERAQACATLVVGDTSLGATCGKGLAQKMKRWSWFGARSKEA